MPYLIYTSRGETIKYELKKMDTTIGRSEDCAIRITDDPEISRIHCSVQKQDADTFVLVDAASKNGTFLNSQRLDNNEMPLRDGDRIRAGRTRLKFVKADEDTTSGALSEIEREMQQGKGYQTIMREIVKRPSK